MENRSGTVLVVDDNPQGREIAADLLRNEGYHVLLAADGAEALRQARERRPDVVVLDRVMPGTSGDEVAAQLKNDEQLRGIKIIILSAKGTTEDKVAGLELGADDYLAKPYQRAELVARVKVHLRTKKAEDALQEAYRRVETAVEERTRELRNTNELLRGEIAERARAEKALNKAVEELESLKNRLQAENVYLQHEIKTQANFEQIIGRSERFAGVLKKVEQVAPTNATVLLLGETGTGKELLARAVHSNSERRGRPLVKVNCAALPATLIESELFGHEKGAFTGALARKIGHFELADGGTIFLDEIGDLPLEMQSKLLRILQEGEFERLGNPRTLKVDVRVIAATNRQLDQAIAQGAFREDLYYRLNVFPIVAPPLRERKADLPVLMEHFIRKYSTKIGKRAGRVSEQGLAAMEAYDWPGNIRELENIIERAIILSDDDHLRVEEQLEPGARGAPAAGADGVTLHEVERNAILKGLGETGWVIEGNNGAARRLGLEPSTLRSRIKKHGIRKPA